MNINPHSNSISTIRTATLTDSPIQSHTTTHAILSEQPKIAHCKKGAKSNYPDLRKETLIKITIDRIKNQKEKSQEDSYYTRMEIQSIARKEGNILILEKSKKIEEIEKLILAIRKSPNDKKSYSKLKKIAQNLQIEINSCTDENKFHDLKEIRDFLKLEISANIIYFIGENIDIVESYTYTKYIQHTISLVKNLIAKASNLCDNEYDKNLLDELKKELTTINGEEEEEEEEEEEKEDLINTSIEAELDFDENDKKILDSVNNLIIYSTEEFININREIGLYFREDREKLSSNPTE